MTITCPYCHLPAPIEGFLVSCADECFCPTCNREFMLSDGPDED
jgi:hypothetical protein